MVSTPVVFDFQPKFPDFSAKWKASLVSCFCEDEICIRAFWPIRPGLIPLPLDGMLAHHRLACKQALYGGNARVARPRVTKNVSRGSLFAARALLPNLQPPKRACSQAISQGYSQQVERGTVRVIHNTMTQPGPFDPESSAVTITPLHLPLVDRAN